MNTRKFPMAMCALMLLAACNTAVVEDKPAPTSDKDAMMQDDKKMDDKMDKEPTDVEASYIGFTGAVGEIKSHEGKFTKFDFKLMPDATDPMNYEKAELMVTLDIESMVTDSNGLTKHLLNPDFFDVAEYPTANFESTSITKIEDDSYTIEGDLTIKDVTQSVSFEADIDDSQFYALFVIDRTEFNVDSDAITSKAINKEVPLEVSIVFPKSN